MYLLSPELKKVSVLGVFFYLQLFGTTRLNFLTYLFKYMTSYPLSEIRSNQLFLLEGGGSFIRIYKTSICCKFRTNLIEETSYKYTDMCTFWIQRKKTIVLGVFFLNLKLFGTTRLNFQAYLFKYVPFSSFPENGTEVKLIILPRSQHL